MIPKTTKEFPCNDTTKLTYSRFVRYPSVSLSPTLSRNEKFEQHIRKKTHKPNALRFWVEGSVILLCGFGSVLIIVRSHQFCPLGLPNRIVSLVKVEII